MFLPFPSDLFFQVPKLRFSKGKNPPQPNSSGSFTPRGTSDRWPLVWSVPPLLQSAPGLCDDHEKPRPTCRQVKEWIVSSLALNLLRCGSSRFITNHHHHHHHHRPTNSQSNPSDYSLSISLQRASLTYITAFYNCQVPIPLKPRLTWADASIVTA